MKKNKFSIISFMVSFLLLCACGNLEPINNKNTTSNTPSQSLNNNGQFESIDDFKKIGPKPGGTVAGALYERKSDHKKYIIKYVTKEVSLNEFLSANFYKAAELLVAHYILIEPGNSLDNYKPNINIQFFKPPYLFIAAEFIENLKGLTAVKQSQMQDVLDGFIIDAWLGNYDVIGFAIDNIMQTEDKNAIRVDVGAALEYRAQGAPKNGGFNENVNEIPFLLNKCDDTCLQNLSLTNADHKRIMENSVQVFRSLTAQNVDRGIKKLNLFSDQKISDIITTVPLLDDDKKLYLAQMLILRRDKIKNHWEAWLKKQIKQNFINP